MGLVVAGLVGEPDRVVATNDEPFPLKYSVLHLQGAVHLYHELTDAGVREGRLLLAVAEIELEAVDEAEAEGCAKDVFTMFWCKERGLGLLFVRSVAHIANDLFKGDLGGGGGRPE